MGTLFSCDRVHSSKWLLTKCAIFGFQLDSNMLNISLETGMFVPMPSGNTYFQWISISFQPFTLFFSLKSIFDDKMISQ